MNGLEQKLRDRLRASVAGLTAEPELLDRAHARAGRRRRLAVAGTLVALLTVGAGVYTAAGVRMFPGSGVALRPVAGPPPVPSSDQRVVEFGGTRLLVPASWAVDDGQPATHDRAPAVCAAPSSQPILLLGDPTERCPLGDGVRLRNPGVAVIQARESPGGNAAFLREGVPVQVGATIGFRLVADGNDSIAVPDLDLLMQILPGTREQEVDGLLATVSPQEGDPIPPFVVWDSGGVLTARDGQVIPLVEPEAGNRIFDVRVAPGGTQDEFQLAVATGGSVPGGRRIAVVAVHHGIDEEVWSGTAATSAYGPGAVTGLEEGGVSGGPVWSPEGSHLAFIDSANGRAVVRIVSLHGQPVEAMSPGLEVIGREGPELYLERWTDGDRLVFVTGGANRTLTLPMRRAVGGVVEIPGGRLQSELPKTTSG